MASCNPRAFVVSRSDNVATLLDAAPAGTEICLLGEVKSGRRLISGEDVSSAHKVALASVRLGEPILKYGHRIGHATRPIAVGEWVHLHNCASDVDERSNALDIQTGVPQDTKEAYE